MNSLWNSWQQLPAEMQIILAGVVMKHLVSLIRVYRPKIDGRAVHAAVIVLSLVAGVATQIATAGVDTKGIASTISIFASAALAAVGYNEMMKKLKP